MPIISRRGVWVEEALSQIFIKRVIALGTIALAVHPRDLGLSEKPSGERGRIWREAREKREMDIQAFASEGGRTRDHLR